jgi:uncharacterized protein (DUF2249 family)
VCAYLLYVNPPHSHDKIFPKLPANKKSTGKVCGQWVEKYSRSHGKFYWESSEKHIRVWRLPDSKSSDAGSSGVNTEENWEQMFSKKHGKVFWINKDTGERVLKMPKSLKTGKPNSQKEENLKTPVYRDDFSSIGSRYSPDIL